MKKEIDLTGQTGCALEYHYWLDIEDGFDYAYVKMATTNYADPNDAGWTTIDAMSDNYDSSDYADEWHSIWWTSGALDISAFDNQIVYLLFYFHSDGLTLREGWYIDNIEITGTGNMYDDYMDTYADVTVDLTGYTNAYLSFVYWMDAEDFYDVFSVSVNRGAGWRTLMLLNDEADEYQYDSYDPDLYARIWWDTGHLDLTPECGFPSVQIRIWFSSDSSTTREGIYIDEFQVASVFFFDDMESGTNGWTSTHAVEPNWHLVTTDYYSFEHSWWCGSDGTGEYGNGMDEYLTHDFDLTYAEEATLQFSFTGFAEQDYDFLFIGISVDGGSNWDYYGGFTGDYSDGWYMAEVDLSGYTRHQALVTFDFYSDKIVTEAGYWIDDVNIYGTIDRIPPGQVTGLTVSTPSEGNTLNVQWTANNEFDIAGYNVYRSLVSGSSYSLVATTLTNSLVDTGLTDGVTYYYVVTAFDVASNEGLESSEASGIPADASPPPAIAAVYAEDLGIGGLVNVSWEPCLESDVAGYKVYYESANFDDTTLATYHLGSPIDDPSATWCHVAGLTNDIQYYFGVTAIDKSSNENTSIVKTAIATPTDITPPEVI
ncbi:MAG: immune inhibitor A, partial [Thermoplasmata archaeon]|nr:immune inhibitor A [Thermoplasmata archaeon]